MELREKDNKEVILTPISNEEVEQDTEAEKIEEAPVVKVRIVIDQQNISPNPC